MGTENLHLELLGERFHLRATNRETIDAILAAAVLLADGANDSTGKKPHLTFTFRDAPDGYEPRVPGGAPRAVSGQRDFVIFADGEELLVVVENRSMARCRFDAGEVTVDIHPVHRTNGWIIGHRLFFLPLLEWMRFRGWYPIHGSCFQVDGRTVLVSGASGAGKSTAALAALASGCPIVSDDTLFACRSGRSVLLDPFPEPIKIGKGSMRFFPEWEGKLHERFNKFIMPEENLPGGRRLFGVSPDILLFPRIVESDATTFSSLSGEEALVRLLPQSVLPAPHGTMQRHIDLLGELVEQVESYRLLFGRDVRALPDRIRTLL